ncbi:MAG: tRNA dihydrouridine(20/20a) synthase DusA [Rhodospirillum sp.]|nr:tRNA dihydrouridine(20/20a) synthase DusA [Rhodospirillum sp.]MCF8491676.1 tRNA dihydrouridine(20/20a) synthase DusA [Rhodospirillum sp.]MCF8502934.1 tRNA dihydrouridine(20/20a) synthase DusA [Rhodospirillum sp.]
MSGSLPDPRKLARDGVDRRLSVAPMMDWTDRHDRWFLRCISRHTLLYTEMVTAPALIRGDPGRHLDYHPEEHPIALQLGGGDPEELGRATRIARDWGYDEINLNVGCPSDRVSSGRFGACLMAEPKLVADCLSAMRAESQTPVTVKHRIGIDEMDGYDHLTRFVDTLAQAGTRVFIVHARKAWLTGLSPKENREIPPLRHEVVHRLKADFPDLDILLNGGIPDIPTALPHIGPTDGVMIGRAAYETPYILAEADRLVFGDPTPPLSRHAVARALVPYLEDLLARGQPVKRLTRHILGLFHGCSGARAWRRHLGEQGPRPEATAQVLLDALAMVPEGPLNPE